LGDFAQIGATMFEAVSQMKTRCPVELEIECDSPNAQNSPSWISCPVAHVENK
jgi:hypothetical protein